jgi:hypothetical protein
VSIRYIAAVLDRLTHLTAAETLVLVALADSASDDTRECWPSMATLARRSRLTRRGVQKILRRLESRALIETATGGHQFGENTANRYRLRFTYDGERLEHVEAKLSPRANGVRPAPPKIIHKGERGSPPGRTARHDKGERGSPHPSCNVFEPSLNRHSGTSDRRGDKSGKQKSLAELLLELSERGKDLAP